MTAAQLRLTTRHRRAARDHADGHLSEAEKGYRAVLAIAPDHAESLHGLGVLALQLGRSDVAAGYIGRAVQLRPQHATFNIDLGRALRAQGHLEEARAALHVAALLAPSEPAAHLELAATLAQMGRGEPALEAYREALRLDPESAVGWTGLALLLRAAGRLEDAETCLRRLVELRPGHAAALGLLGAVLVDRGAMDAAAEVLQDARRVAPDDAEIGNNLGLALQGLGRLPEAVEAFGHALKLQPDSADIRTNLAGMLRDWGRADDAEAELRRVLQRHPRHAAARYNLATLQLAAGDFTAAWPGFEARLQLPGRVSRGFTQPQWRGEALPGATVLLHAEQGFGDTLQFCRYVPLVAQCARVVLEVPAPLVRLLSTLPAVVVARGAALPAFDMHCPLPSLPGVFATTPATIPNAMPYLAAPAAPDWRPRLTRLPGLHVGLCWAGSGAYSHDRWRSLAPSALAALGNLPGVTFISLQKVIAEPPPLAIYDWGAALGDFADTAALIAQLDLVISVDTAVAHLAGALGRPVWLLNRFDADWRWLRDRDDSPWYPTLRQFRQESPGDWPGVLRRVRDELLATVANRRETSQNR
jgi:Flp pilus assembly protein TadD